MTEADWLTCTNPTLMLDFLGDSASPRKLRLFACAWAYDLWRLQSDDRSREAVLAAERYADGEASVHELRAAHRAATDALRDIPQRFVRGPFGKRLGGRCGTWVSERAAEVARDAADPEWGTRTEFQIVKWQKGSTRYALSNYLRDLIGNPFRPTAFDPEWLTSTVVSLGRVGYESGDFSVLPILADALQDAGCGDEPLLAHCRDAQAVHIRGCWVVDLVLGKE